MLGGIGSAVVKLCTVQTSVLDKECFVLSVLSHHKETPKCRLKRVSMSFKDGLNVVME